MSRPFRHRCGCPSTTPVQSDLLLSQFFTALRERRIVGVRGSDGRVHVPPRRVRPRHLRRADRDRTGGQRRNGGVVDVAARTARGPAAGPSVRVGADQARRRRHRAAARGRRRLGCGDQHRCAGARALGRRTGRRDHRHRVLRARRRGRAGGRHDGRPRSGDHARRPDLDRNPAHRITSRERVPACARGGQAARSAHRQGRKGVLPGARGRSGRRASSSTSSSNCRTRAR